MSAWWWVLIGLAVWFAPVVVVALMLGWAIWRPMRARPSPGLEAEKREPPQEDEPPQMGGGAA